MKSEARRFAWRGAARSVPQDGDTLKYPCMGRDARSFHSGCAVVFEVPVEKLCTGHAVALQHADTLDMSDTCTRALSSADSKHFGR